jgi:hypothetical protein
MHDLLEISSQLSRAIVRILGMADQVRSTITRLLTDRSLDETERVQPCFNEHTTDRIDGEAMRLTGRKSSRTRRIALSEDAEFAAQAAGPGSNSSFVAKTRMAPLLLVGTDK